MLRINHRGNFNNTEKFLIKAQRLNVLAILRRYGEAGVDALSKATPKDTGVTAASWKFKVEIKQAGYSISWYNTNEPNGVPLAILIQYGHGTGTGGYVSGIDYINPAMKPIFDKLAEDLWKEVTSL